MNMVILNEVRKGFYLDSVALMRMSKALADIDGVDEAAMMMGSPSNREIMSNAGLLEKAGEQAGGGDLIIGIRANSQQAAESALAEAGLQLDKPAARGDGTNTWNPKTLRAALKICPDASLALISVPGDFALGEARKAIRRGLHAMIFSDNVDLDGEAELKREARELGKLVMGPDCGTAIINGVALAFANVVPRGKIGIVGASGTGTQEVSCLIAQYGGGISHAIGVGGRDLKSAVGGISTLMAMDLLDQDPSTEHIAIVSKPPPADIAATVLERIATSSKPATICFIGAEPMAMPANATQVFTLKAAAEIAMGMPVSEAPAADNAITLPAGRSRITGLYSGGTLCAEAQVLIQNAGLAVRSNAAIPGVQPLVEDHNDHVVIDLGDDDYTQGKPHPMIDPSVRDDAIVSALKDNQSGVILLDVVIGYGAHADPAGHLAGILEAHATSDSPPVIASVTGTETDPQVRSMQVSRLESAGVHVAPTNADATAWALQAIAGGR